MDHQAFAQLLGNYGEFVGAFAVVGTLVYLAIQVRHGKIATEANTLAIEESRKLALAQSFQARTQLVDASMVEIANSGELAPIMYKGFQAQRNIWKNRFREAAWRDTFLVFCSQNGFTFADLG
jgi:hypothetical protein